MENNQLADINDLPQTMEVQAGLIATHCYRDRDYRNQLVDDAKGTLSTIARNFYQENIKDEALKEKALARIEAEKDLNLDIVVCQNTATKWHIPLPPVGGHKTLSEKELQQVSGGEFGISAGLIGSAISAGIAGLASTIASVVAIGGVTLGVAAALAGTGIAATYAATGRIIQ